jgi:hypothetical protein
MPARAITALDIALRRHGQMHAAVLVMISPEAGMPLDIFQCARICHGFSPSAAGGHSSPLAGTAKSPEEITLPGFFA